MKPDRDTPEALAREIELRMQNEWKEGMKRNELRAWIAKDYGLNAEHVRRYMRILHLVPELLQMVNSGQISVHAGAELSFLSEENQRLIFGCLKDRSCGISIGEATSLKKKYKKGVIDRSELENYISDKERVIVVIPYGRSDLDSFLEELSEEKLYEKVYRIIHDWEDSKKKRA